MIEFPALVRLARTSLFALLVASAGCKKAADEPSVVEPPPGTDPTDQPAEPGTTIPDDADGFDVKADADVSNPAVVEAFAAASAARMFWLPYAVYGGVSDGAGLCPVIENGDNMVTVTGGCTATDGTVYSGSLVATGAPGGLLLGTLDMQSFGISRDVPCLGGGVVTERRSWDGAFDFDDVDGSFTLALSGIATAIDPDACTGRPYDFHADYEGVVADLDTDPVFDGAGRYSDSRFGTAAVETVDELLGACDYEPMSGTTLLRGAGREAGILYDGVVDCDVDATVAWTLDGEVRGTLQGVTCSSTGAAPLGLLPLLGGLGLLGLLRRRRGLAGVALVAVAASVGACKKKEPEVNFETVEDPSGLTVRLDRKAYRTGDEPQATLVTAGIGSLTTEAPIVLSCEASEDAEVMTFSSDLVAGGITIEIGDGPGTPEDGVLTVPPGAAFFALYAVDRDDPALKDIPEDLVFDVAVGAGERPEVPSTVEPAIALTPDELSPPPGGKVLGTLFEEGGVPVQVPTRELIAITADLDELDRLLARTGGEVIDGPYDDDGALETLISIDPARFDTEGLSGLRALFEEQGELTSSNDEGLRIYMAALALQTEGYKVALNPRLNSFGAPTTREREDNELLASMQLREVPGGSEGCVPDDPANPCIGSVPALWAHMALVGADQRRIPVAFLDNGFAPNSDFRRPRSGDFVQCDLEGPTFCGPGAAEGAPTVGASLFGDRVWHGNGVVTVAGGVVNNGQAAGVGGQVVEPMLYRLGLASYAFEVGAGIRHAVDDGASCINISAGYPCRILLSVGPDFDICSIEGRAGICALLTAAAHAAAATACATLGPIPFVGPALCAAAISGAVTVTNACLATLALGDLQYSMARGVRYAEQRGVPVIASAGNRMNPDALPDILRDVVDLDNTSLDDWRVIPASLPSVIAVGAVDSGDYTNLHFHGELVDVWAPISSAYFAPESVDDPGSTQVWNSLGGTSAAAPFITGVVAAMQAADPTLDPNNRSLTDAQRGEIVGRIRGHLRSDVATFSDAELVARGLPSDPLRTRVIDPLSAVRAVTPLQIQLEDRDYDLGLCFDEPAGGLDDVPEDARTLIVGDTLEGTLVDIVPDGGTGIDRPDVDWFDFVLPGGGARAGVATIEVRSVGRGRPFIRGAAIPLRSFGGGVEKVGVYEALIEPGAPSIPFALDGGPAAYKISASVEEADPSVRIVLPFDGAVRCTGAPIRFEAAAGYVGFATSGIPDGEIDWTLDGSAGTGAAVTRSFADPGDIDVSVRVFDDPTTTDAITLTLEDCIGSPPEVTITTPLDVPGQGPDVQLWTSGNDAIGAYAEVTFQASVFDPDEIIPDADIVWTTDQPAVQGGTSLLGTGRNLTARLYSSCAGGTSVTHEVIVTVTDAAGNYTTARRVIQVLILC